ncbi:hypothetical protein L6452_11882 [Arctium lappa]|uniref:Uncharacterized protein n=1 Tax=Arctium lappa TaxID=4217 RepID=A0ACB9DPL7_ARCLA|nr:hypothetical protein L6452_11882 [Arctium lappa]
MQDYIDDSEDTLSLCDLLIEDLEEDQLSSKPNSSSSSSSSSSEQDFLGFFTEEWVRNTNSYENIIFCGKIVSSTRLIAGDKNQETKISQIHPPFRSNSDSFRYMRLKTASKPSTSRSKSLPNRSASSPICKSRWLVFMFGSGSSKFPTMIDVSDIKSRQVRRQNTMGTPSVSGGGRTIGSKGWWRFVDVLGCGGGYDRDTVRVY